MAAVEFLQFHCVNSDSASCAACPKDFVIPTNAVEGIYKDPMGKALILILDTHYCPFPLCGDKLRFIETSLTFEEVLSALSMKIYNLGNINLTYQDNITKR